MLTDRVSNPGPLTYESGALPIALRGPALNKREREREYPQPQTTDFNQSQWRKTKGRVNLCSDQDLLLQQKILQLTCNRENIIRRLEHLYI